VPGPQQPPGHLRDAIRELRDYSSEAVANRRVRDVWELARHLFTDTVCRALKITKPRPYDESRLVRYSSPPRPKRYRSPSPERRSVTYEEEEAYRSGPSRPRRDLLLDDTDQRDLEVLQRQTAYDKQLIEQVKARAAERAEKEREILLSAQLKEATLLQRQQQSHSDAQVNLIKASAPTAPKTRVVQTESNSKLESRKRKAEKPSPSEDILCLELEKEDYCDTPVASTSNQVLFGPETPPKNPGKEWYKVNEELQRRSKRDKTSSPKEAKSASRRDSKKKDKPNPYVKLTKLDNEQLTTTLKSRSTKDKSSEADAQARDKSPQPTSTRTRGLTSPDSSPEPRFNRGKIRIARTPRC
jgi:hypothetical protein